MSDLVLLFLAAGAGVFIGSVGIGGVLLVPALALFADVPVHTAIAASLLSYVTSGAVGTAIYAAKGSIRWRPVAQLAAGAMPGALLGALAAASIGAPVLEALIGVFCLLSGLRALVRRLPSAVAAETSGTLLAVVGLGVGFGSALTGTGGPLLLVPTLTWLGMPILATLGLAQAIQLPIALLATAGNTLTSQIEWQLGGLLSIGLLAGVSAGSFLAHHLSARRLQQGVAALMIVVGVLVTVRAIMP